MTPNELREAVAKEIRAARNALNPTSLVTFPIPSDYLLADAAICVVREAMREPSEEMLLAGKECEAKAWRAMLAASPLREE